MLAKRRFSNALYECACSIPDTQPSARGEATDFDALLEEQDREKRLWRGSCKLRSKFMIVLDVLTTVYWSDVNLLTVPRIKPDFLPV